MRFLSFLLLTIAASAAPRDQPVVEVFVPPLLRAEMDLALMRAQGVVQEIYSGIGVRVVWRSARSAPSGCAKEPQHWKIVVAFREATPGVSEQAMAFSNPYLQQGPCVTLLMDRLKRDVERNPSSTGFLLGHILAHEMGHVLQAVARHSETGVMKSRWSAPEIMNMRKERLRFTEFDTSLIRRVLASPEILRVVDDREMITPPGAGVRARRRRS